MKEIEYDRDVEWTVTVDNRKRIPHYRHSCHQCGLVVVTFSSTTSPREAVAHERKHQVMWGIQQYELEEPPPDSGATFDEWNSDKGDSEIVLIGKEANG